MNYWKNNYENILLLTCNNLFETIMYVKVTVRLKSLYTISAVFKLSPAGYKNVPREQIA